MDAEFAPKLRKIDLLAAQGGAEPYHVILEANASEHSARRLAMKTASDNASDLGQALNLQYNKVRQASITNQIIEISAGAEAQS